MSENLNKHEPLLQVEDLCQYFNVGKNKTLKAVDHVNFSIYRGETLGLVGESGAETGWPKPQPYVPVPP